jgi:Mechanosensitive ion channel, conserved TM helix
LIFFNPKKKEEHMESSAFMQAIGNTFGTQLPAILGAVGILIVGYIVALAARAASRKLLALIGVNARLSESAGKEVDVEGGVGLAVFWLVLLVTLVGVFNTLQLQDVSGLFGTFVNQIFDYLPNLLAGVFLLLVAWLVATLVRTIANRGLKASKWDEKLSEQAGTAPIGDSAGNVLFWLVLLLFLPAVLGAFQLEGLVEPVRGMVGEALAMLPNIFGAVVILFAGWLVASVLRGVVTNLLATAGADKAGQKAGIVESVQLSRLVGMLVFVLIIIPVIVAALDALQIETISGPARDMLGMIMMAIPNVFAAALILLLTYYVARVASGLVGRLLASMGFDRLPAMIGLDNVVTDDFKPSDVVAYIILFFAMLFATVEAANRLDFNQVQGLVGMFIQFGTDILLGVVILLIGFWLANLAHTAIMRANGKAAGIAAIARYAILGLVLAMGLRAMGIANDIVNIAFALVFGAVAVAIALSFGLGGREAAGKQMEYWLANLRKEK